MECLNQFSFWAAKSTNFTAASGTFSPYAVGTDNAWIVSSGINSSIFQVEGFKNINLYGVKLISSVQSSIAGNKGIVENYDLQILINGTEPQIGGKFSVNDWGITQDITLLTLGKYANEVNFTEPIQSVKSIRVNVFSAQGYSAQSLISIDLDIIFQLYFYYKFEGEEFAFL